MQRSPLDSVASLHLYPHPLMQPWQRTLWIMVFAQFIVTAGFGIIFPFLPLYVQDLGTNTTFSIEFLSGLVFSAQAVTMMIAAPLWGLVADRYGRKLMVERAMFGGAFILLLMAFARSAEELILLRTIQGLISGTVSAGNALVAAQVPRERAGYAMGMLQMSIWSGLAIGPLMGGTLADLYGYHVPFIVTAILISLGGVMVWWGVEENFTPDLNHQKPLNPLTEWHQVIGAPQVSLTFFLSFLNQLSRYMTIAIMPLFIQILMPNANWAASMTGLVVAISSITATVSAVYLGKLSDKIGYRRVMIASALLGSMTYLAQSAVNSAWQLLLLQALGGIATGGLLPVIAALLAQYTQHGDEGVVYGIDSSVGSGARAIAPLIGSSVAIWFDLHMAFIVSGLILLLIATIAMWRLPQDHISPQPKFA